ncbi:Glycosyltransferase family 29 (sialyltransferase) [Salegentibacter holothuriorum]|uniref:Glycosyltransferase family 29 (Sialyltransferase) n=2 Tax=Salegentibacter holothuriorum TaxID=241145 RepID=A0A1T5AP46_9FLAO|nr:Glycosyltransferase family 29 (sialyltransferase) [Salegentibacter holothuriorum]
MFLSLRIFNLKRHLKDKRVAIIGAADSVFDEKNGDYIDSFDVVIRINKSALVWNKENADYLGSKFTYLFHSFYENNYSGGGPINFKEFKKLGIQNLVHPNSDSKGLKAHLNFYKRHLKLKKTYILSPRLYKKITKELGCFQPTVGFSAIYSALNTDCKELYLTGFTFFKSPYLPGYRDDLRDTISNKRHIEKQGIHDPDVEFEVFKNLVQNSGNKRIILDSRLRKLIT